MPEICVQMVGGYKHTRKYCRASEYIDISGWSSVGGALDGVGPGWDSSGPEEDGVGTR